MTKPNPPRRCARCGLPGPSLTDDFNCHVRAGRHYDLSIYLCERCEALLAQAIHDWIATWPVRAVDTDDARG